MTREEHIQFIEGRRKGIGGSDVAAIFGITKWASPLSVYLNKIGESAPTEDNEYSEWGRILEAPIANKFSAVTGKKLRRRKQTLVSKEHDFIIAHIDRDVVGENAGLEVKTAIEYKRHQWEDAVPTEYILQCLHYMYVTGATHWYIAVLIGGHHFDWFRIDRDDEAIGIMVEREKEFWNDHVQKRIPPSATAADSQLLSMLYPKPKKDEEVQLGSDSNQVVRDYLNIKESIKNLEHRKDELENVIKSKLKDNEIGLTENFKISWKQTVSSRFDTIDFKSSYPDLFHKFLKPSSFRRFGIKELKNE